MAAAALAVLVILGFAGKSWRESEPVVSVQTGTAIPISRIGVGASVLDASGYVVARRTATVSAQITGVVTEVLFDEGDYVEQGQVLARLDAQSASANLEASMRQAAAAGQLARQYEVQLVQAERESTRAQELAENRLVSQQEAEQAIAKADELRAQLMYQRRSVEASRAQAKVAEVNLGYTVVRAPFSGIITSKAAQVGEIISPSASSGYTRTGIATIVDMNSLEVEVEVGEAYIGKVRPSMAAEVRLNAYPELKIPAEVIAIIPAADRGTATVKVRVALKIQDARIVPDMGARVSFMDESTVEVAAADTVSVPASALVRRDDQDVAFVVQADGTVRQRVLKLGANLGEDRKVLAGLHAGEHVVLNPAAQLKEGKKVDVRNE